MLRLAIDVGNTHTVLGVFRKEKLLTDWRIASTTERTEDETWLSLQLFCSHAKISPKDMRGVVISSVVPNLTGIYSMMAEKYLKAKPVIVSAALRLGIKVLYQDPMAVGADRLCNAVAAYTKFGGPAIVIDFGTATTYDVISKKGEYMGGVIAPGVETASAELHRRAAKLPRIELQLPKNVIGSNTVESMQSGILYGAVDAMEGMVKRIRNVIGKDARVIATGGYAKIIASQSPTVQHVEPALVLEGARLIYERVSAKKRRIHRF